LIAVAGFSNSEIGSKKKATDTGALKDYDVVILILPGIHGK
jgi:hypothetical protein